MPEQQEPRHSPQGQGMVVVVVVVVVVVSDIVSVQASVQVHIYFLGRTITYYVGNYLKL
jgi:hypothetical protein